MTRGGSKRHLIDNNNEEPFQAKVTFSRMCTEADLDTLLIRQGSRRNLDINSEVGLTKRNKVTASDFDGVLTRRGSKRHLINDNAHVKNAQFVTAITPLGSAQNSFKIKATEQSQH